MKNDSLRQAIAREEAQLADLTHRHNESRERLAALKTKLATSEATPAASSSQIIQPRADIAIDTAFARSIAAGLIALAAMDNATNLSPALGYWRTFTCQYLSKRCQMTPAEQVHPDPVAALNEQQTALLLESTPPMRGAEYLSPLFGAYRFQFTHQPGAR